MVAVIGMMTLACGFFGGKEEAEAEAEAPQPAAVEAIPEVESAPAEQEAQEVQEAPPAPAAVEAEEGCAGGERRADVLPR